MKNGLVSLFLVGGLLAAIVGAFFGVKTLFFKPHSIDAFFFRAAASLALNDPEELSRLRILERYGLDFHNDELTDASLAFRREQIGRQRKLLEWLRSYDRAALTPSQRTSYDVVEWAFDLAVDGERWLLHDYPFDHIRGVHTALPEFLIRTHTVQTLDDARNYVLRLSRFGEKFDQTIAALQEREHANIYPPRTIVDRIIEQCREMIAPPPEGNVLLEALVEKLDRLDDVPDGLRGALLEDARYELQRVIYPAYRRLIAYLENLRFKAAGDQGVGTWPHGEEYYAWTVRQHTTTSLTAQEIHDLGTREVKRIEREIDRILRAQGLEEGTVGDRLNALSRQPRFLYGDDERDQAVIDFERMIRQAEARLPKFFKTLPSEGIRVERIAASREDDLPAAYYDSPPLNDDRPGTLWVNLRDLGDLPKFSMRSLTHHETVPGHHLQLSIQQDLEELPLIRRTMPFTAFVEGWAMYAEALAKEMGLLDDPFDNLGRLRAELLRAVRLVVDTGIHDRGWSRNEAIAYMRAITGRPESEVANEVDRYLVLPGQALAYKVGMIRILRMRAEAERAMGGRFDLPEFHDVLLLGGSLPLEILDERVADYIHPIDR